MEGSTAENPVCDQWKSDKKDDVIDLDNGRRKNADLMGLSTYSGFIIVSNIL